VTAIPGPNPASVDAGFKKSLLALFLQRWRAMVGGVGTTPPVGK